MGGKLSDPFDFLPTYEREIIRLRAFELTLVLFYKEEIVRTVLDQIECHDRFKRKQDKDFVERAPKGSKYRVKKALNAMVSDGAISEDERERIKNAIEFRNDIGHRIDQLFSDMEQTRFTGRHIEDYWRKLAKIREFDHPAVKSMQEIESILDRTRRTHYNIGTFRWNGRLFFSSTERILLSEIKRTRKKLSRLSIGRQQLVDKTNEELERGHKLLNSLMTTRYFSIRFDLGKMTARGEEVCYRLFDMGLSDLTVAHIFKMKIRSIQKRRKTWQTMGANMRPIPEFADIPAVVARSRFDD